jgi:lipid-binding SYLF domain-containing protein
VIVTHRLNYEGTTIMIRKGVFISSLVALVVLTLGANVAARAAESKSVIDASVADSLQQFKAANPQNAELLRKAVGVLVFPRITKAGVGIGGEHGDGALLKGGVTAGYYGVTSASVGATLGAGQRSEILLFMTPEALAKFESSKGYSLGVDAQVAVVSKGAGGDYDTETTKKPILGFVFNEKGLLGDVSLSGSKIKKIQPA